MIIGQTVGPLSVRDLLRLANNRISPTDNWQAKVMGPITTPGTADVEFTVQHNLGIKPTNYIWNVDKACTVYDSQRANWTEQQMFLKCSAPSATLYLIIV